MNTLNSKFSSGSEYTHLDYCRRPMRKDLGKKMLYRDAHMTGWTYKEITTDDLKFRLRNAPVEFSARVVKSQL